MKVLLDIKDSEAPSLMRVLRSLPYVKAQTITPSMDQGSAEHDNHDFPSIKDAVLGIGRPFTQKELDSYLTNTAEGNSNNATAVKRNLKKRIAQRLSEK